MLGLGNLLTKSGVIKKFPNDFSFNFDGSNDYLDLPEDIVPNTSIESNGITLSAWINIDTTGSRKAIVGQADNQHDDFTSGGLYIDSSNRLEFMIFKNSSYTATVSSTTFSAGSWHHVLATYSGESSDDKVRIYVDGSLETTSSALGGDMISGTNNNNFIGKNCHSSDTNFFDGFIDEVAVWNTALSASDVAKIASKPVDLSKASKYATDRTGNLKLWLRAGDKALPEEDASIARQDFYTDFDGTDDVVTIGASNNIVTGNDVTLMAWFKNLGTTRAYVIQNQKGAGSTNITMQINANDASDSAGFIGGLVWSGTHHLYVSVDGSVDDGKWHHLVFTTTATTQQVYLDGVLKTTESNTFANASSSDVTNIGTDGGNNYPFTGKISNVGIYKTVLDAQTISQMAKSRFTPMRDNRFSVVDFDGTDDHIVLGGSSPSSSFSISAWVFDTHASASSHFSAIYASNSTNIWFGVQNNTSGKVRLHINGDGNYADTPSGSFSSPSNKWIHLVGTWDGSNAKIYIDGVSQTLSVTGTLATPSANANPTIGINDNDLSLNQWTGSISSVAIYSDAKDANFIYAQYQKGITHNPSADTGLVGLWRMGDDTSKAYPTIADSSSNSNDGTITNGASDDIVQQMVAGYDMGAFESTEELSAERITNGDFSAWTADNPDGWTVSTDLVGGVESDDVKVTEDANGARIFTTGTNINLRQNSAMIVGTMYKVTIVVHSATSGDIKTTGLTSNITNINASGTYTVTTTASSTTLNIKRNTACDIVVSSVSVKEVLQSEVSDTYPAIIDVNEPVLGAEEVTSLTNFSGGIESFSSSGNTMTASNTSGVSYVVSNELGATVGKVYKVNISKDSIVGTIQVFMANSSGTIDSDHNSFPSGTETLTSNSSDVYYVTFADADYDYLWFSFSGGTSTITNATISIKEVLGNVGTMTNQDSADLVYSSVLPDQSFLTGLNSAYNFVSLDGSNDYIKNESFTGHQQDTGTISIWVKFGDISGFQYITGVGGNASTGTNRVITLSDENLRFSGYSADYDTGADVVADNWYHIVLIWNGTSVTFYLDGTAYTNTVSNLVTPTGTNFVVGAYPAGFGGKAHADFGTVAHWNKVLTSTEVNAIKDLGRHGNLLDSYSDNLKLCYSMSGLDAKTGFSDTATTIYDRSGNSNHGTTVSIASSDLKSSPNAEPNGYAKGDTNRSTTIP